LIYINRNNTIHGIIKITPHIRDLLPFIEGKIKLNNKLVKIAAIKDIMVIHKNESGGFPVITSQKPIKNAVIKP
jgi:hypothetical protein